TTRNPWPRTSPKMPRSSRSRPRTSPPSTTPTECRGGSGSSSGRTPSAHRFAWRRTGRLPRRSPMKAPVASPPQCAFGSRALAAWGCTRCFVQPSVTIRAVISDFGGVLTTPLLGSFLAFQDETGISSESLGVAMQRIAERQGEHPLFELERGRVSEADFLAALGDELASELGHRPELHRFGEIYFDALDPNEPMIELMRGLRDRGYRMALLTNNVREWE